MDGVTDAPFRLMTAKYGKADLHITEFTSVEGICAGATKMLGAFQYDEIERPIVAQLFGSTPECFYKAAFLVCELGFDGIDINMGCPAKNIASKGSGAALILTPLLAQEIIRSTKKGAADWYNGKRIEESGLPIDIIEYTRQAQAAHHQKSSQKKSPGANPKRQLLPVSVKTRIGYNSVVIEDWVKFLLETEPANISVHGRTLQQMYSGEANWEAIAKAAQVIHQTSTTVLGNGDIKSLVDAEEKIKKYEVDGVLVGRATFGNPAFFNKNKQPTLPEKLKIAIEHAELHEKTFGPKLFVSMRKHLTWYCRGFDGAAEIRQELMQTTSAAEVKNILEKIGENIKYK